MYVCALEMGLPKVWHVPPPPPQPSSHATRLARSRGEVRGGRDRSSDRSIGDCPPKSIDGAHSWAPIARKKWATMCELPPCAIDPPVDRSCQEEAFESPQQQAELSPRSPFCPPEFLVEAGVQGVQAVQAGTTASIGGPGSHAIGHIQRPNLALGAMMTSFIDNVGREAQMNPEFS